MLRQIIFATVMAMVLFGMATISMADYDDFISESEFKKSKGYCDEQFDNCEASCAKTSKKPVKCGQKCIKNMGKCYKNATKNSIEVSKLPKDAKKLWDKIAKKQDKGVRKCQSKFVKGIMKCDKKHLSKSQTPKDQKNYSNCINKNQLNTKQDVCLDNVMSKNTFKTKKMIKLLKGKKP